MQDVARWQQFLKQRLQSRPLRYVTGICNQARPEAPCRRHWHQGLEAVFHPTGSGVTRLGHGQAITFEERSVVLYAPGQLHDQTSAKAGEDHCVQIAIPSQQRAKLRGALYLPQLQDPRAITEFQSLSRGYTKASRTEQAFLNARATTLILQMIHLALNWRDAAKAPSGANFVREAERYLRKEFQNIESLEQVARHVGLSSNHLRHLFKTVHGKSMIAYLNEVRLERAQSLLTHSRLPLKEIARLCGYKDEYYFSAVFRRQTRVAPGHYRRASLP